LLSLCNRTKLTLAPIGISVDNRFFESFISIRSILSKLILFVAIACTDAMSIKPEDDFSGYMESLKAHEMQDQAYQNQLAEHELWRQTTWGGWVVRQLQALGDHFSPFFEAIADTVQSDKNTPAQLVLLAVIRSLTIAAYVAALYALLRIANAILGREIVIEEEIVVDHDEDTHDDSKDGNLVQEVRRSARDKKNR
jgi:hypothetical protein